MKSTSLEGIEGYVLPRNSALCANGVPLQIGFIARTAGTPSSTLAARLKSSRRKIVRFYDSAL